MKREFMVLALTLSLLIMLISCSETTTEPVTDSDPQQTLPAPIFNPSSGTYSTFQPVSISCKVEDATIRYIILDSADDERTVRKSSPAYTEPLLISEQKIIKAKAYKEGWQPSEVSTGYYTITDSIKTVGSLTLSVSPDTVYADNGISYATVKAEVRDGNDFPIVGFPVQFKCSPTGMIASDILTDYDGVATVNYYDTGEECESVTITARIGGVEKTVSVEVLPIPILSTRLSAIYRKPGNTYWQFYSEVKPLNIDSDYEAIVIIAEVKDKYGNPVQDGIPIMIETNHGRIDPIQTTESFAVKIKDDTSGEIYTIEYTGTAKANYYLPDTPGIATVSVGHHKMTLIIISGEISSLHFSDYADDPIYLDAQNAGGVESRLIRVELRDRFGNIVKNPEHHNFPPIVEFDILEPAPEGLNINNEGLNALVKSDGGVARVSVNSGSEAGTAILRARLEEDHNIKATQKIIVKTGPPEKILLFAEGFNQGIALGDGMWKIRVGARFVDIHDNGVNLPEGTAVHFSLTGDYPEGTYIESVAYVDEHEDEEYTTPGTALVWLYYQGNSTNSPVTVRAVTGGAMNEKRFNLPLQFPELDITASVEQIDFFVEEGWPERHYVEIVATVNDGQGNSIAGQEILLTCSQGDLIHHGLAFGEYQGDRPRNIITHAGGFHYQRMYPIDSGMPVGPPQEWPDGDKRPPHTTISERGKAYGLVYVCIDDLPPPWGGIVIDIQMTARILKTDTIAQANLRVRIHYP